MKKSRTVRTVEHFVVDRSTAVILPVDLRVSSEALKALLAGYPLDHTHDLERFGQYAALLEQLNFVCLVAERGHEVAAVRTAWDRIKHEHPTLAEIIEGEHPVRVSALPETPPGDTYNAEVLAECYRDAMRYCGKLGGWFLWTGTHWREDVDGQAMEYARTAMRALGEYAARYESRELLKYVSKLFTHRTLTNCLAQAQSLPSLVASEDTFDRDHWLLNCANGTLDLRSATLRPHNPNDWITKCLPIPYEPTAKAPTWHRFLWRIMGGPAADEEGNEAALLERHERAERLIGFLQRAVGYALTGRTHEECLFILYGSGRNGKSVFLDALKALLGPYAKTAQMSSFLHQDRETIRNDLADLKGVRLVTALEASQGSRFSEGLIKQLTGGVDAVKARFLHHEYFEFQPHFKLFFAFNHRPEIRGTDPAIWERVRTIPFTVFIPPEERDPHLSDTLKAELPGILAWAVQGCLAWQQGSLQPPPEVRQATDEYRLDMDRLGRFIDDRCLVSSTVRTQAGVLFDAYQRWCKAEGEEGLNQTAFGRQLGERGFPVEKSGGKKWRVGIGLIPEGEEA